MSGQSRSQDHRVLLSALQAQRKRARAPNGEERLEGYEGICLAADLSWAFGESLNMRSLRMTNAKP
jgi:hypothetical protein